MTIARSRNRNPRAALSPSLCIRFEDNEHSAWHRTCCVCTPTLNVINSVWTTSLTWSEPVSTPGPSLPCDSS